MLVHGHDVIKGHRYLSRSDGAGAGRHDSNILDNIIYKFSEDRSLAMFRMHRPSFWQLGNILKDAGGRGYWDGQEHVVRTVGGRPPWPAYQQIAVTLYLLGAAGGGRERSGVNLNIGKGTVTRYI